jgi:hypothetical protein
MPKKRKSHADSHTRRHSGRKNSHVKPTEQELQLIEMIRELEEGNEFQLTVARSLGAWNVTLSVTPLVAYPSRGVGVTFNEAWDNSAPVGL